MTRIRQSLLILQMIRYGKPPIVKYMVILHLASSVDAAGTPKPVDNQELTFRMGAPQYGLLRELVAQGLARAVGESGFEITPEGIDYARQIIDGNPSEIMPGTSKKPDMKKVHAFLGTPTPKR